jgi:hypothetical protein
VPLVVEARPDAGGYRELGRRTRAFATWSAKVPAVTARFVRVRALRQTMLHLARVEVR